MITNVNCPQKTVQKTLALTPARAPALAGGATGSSEFVGQPTRPREGRKRERRGSRYEVGAGPDPSGDRAGPCTVGARPPRSPGPGPAKRGAEARAAPAEGAIGVPAAPLKPGFVPEKTCPFSRTLTLHPAAQVFAHFFPGGLVPMQGRPRMTTGPRGEQLGGSRPGPEALSCPPPRAQQRARRKVVGGHLDPAHRPRYLWPVRWSPGRGGRGGAQPRSGCNFQRAAAVRRLYRAGVSRPIGARGARAQTAVPGDRFRCAGDTFLSSCFTPVLCTCGGYGGSFLFCFVF